MVPLDFFDGELFAGGPAGTRGFAGGARLVVHEQSFDGLVRLFDTTTGRPLVTLLSLPPKQDRSDWLALSPEGYAAGEPALLKQGQWRMGAQDVTSEALWKVLALPDRVAASARGATTPAPFLK